ncbi:hypothetical protein GGI05_005003, partial [Coemansia sp. RSA 2603]
MDNNFFVNKVPLTTVKWGHANPLYKERLEALVCHVHLMTVHMYQFARFIFISEFSLDPSFPIHTYICHSFFYEVFLCFDLQRRPITTKNNHTLAIRALLTKHHQAYSIATGIATSLDEIVSAPNLNLGTFSAIANSTAIQAVTAYNNGVKNQFGNFLRRTINRILDTKTRKKQLENSREWANDHEFRAACEEEIWKPARIFKDAIANAKPDNLSDEMKELFRPMFAAYGTYTSEKGLYYDAKAHPERHLGAFYHVCRILEDKRVTNAQCFPLRTSFSPCHMTISTEVLCRNILQIPYNTTKPPLLEETWGLVLDLKSKPFKPTSGHQFRGTVSTDAVSIQVQMELLSLNKSRFKRKRDKDSAASAAPTASAASAAPTASAASAAPTKKKSKIAQEFRYIHELSKNELEAIKDRVVFIDPGRRDLLYCMSINSTAKPWKTYRYTSNQRHSDTKMRHYRKLRNAIKPSEVSEAENRLSQLPGTSTNLEKFSSYLERRSQEADTLTRYYTTTQTVRRHDDAGKVSTTDQLTYPLFRRLLLSAHINMRQANEHLVQNLRAKFGADAVL